MTELMRLHTNKIMLFSLLLAFGIVLGILESRLPILAAVPGAKLGIANVTTVVALYIFGPIPAFVLAFLRAVMSGVLSGMVTSIIYSIAGALFSVPSMYFSKKFMGTKLSAVGVNIIGAFMFNVGQVAVFALVISNINMFRYLPVLSLISAVSGAAVGVCANFVIKFVKKAI